MHNYIFNAENMPNIIIIIHTTSNLHKRRAIPLSKRFCMLQLFYAPLLNMKVLCDIVKVLNKMAYKQKRKEVMVMKYDFTSIPDRSNCGSSKWNAVPGCSVEKVPLSTADMEFPMAPEIIEGLKELADTTILGYTNPTETYYQAVCGWMKKRHDFEIQPDWIVMTPGVVYALGLIVEALSKPGESVIIMPPVYYPFDMSVLAKRRNIEYCPLKLEGTTYSIDYELLAEKAALPECTLLLFCNPHNPVGRVWKREELEKVAEICTDNGVFIIDDEIHNDLIMPGYEHTVLANISEKVKMNCAVCTAPSKTFNLAGLQCSNIIIPNDEKRARVFAANLLSLNISLNIFAYKACETAYTKCEAWLDELIQVIKGNADYIMEFMKEYFPEVTVYPLEGTYLLWLDMRRLGMTHKELEAFMKEEAGLYLDEGYIFGEGGRGYERINLACSRTTLERSMERFKAAMDRTRAKWEQEGKPYHQTLVPGSVVEGFLYDTVTEKGVRLEDRIVKPTILIFLRYESCQLCRGILHEIAASYETILKNGFEVKAVIQSPPEEVAAMAEEGGLPFECIGDGEAKLYDRYNVFEADSMVGLVAGDKQFMAKTGGDIRQLLVPAFLSNDKEGSGKRANQLPALFVISPEMKVLYAHYAKTVMDLPPIEEVLKEPVKA